MSNFAKDQKLDVLTKTHQWAYGMGHYVNDLVGALGFNFLLIYLKNINPIDKVKPAFYAGYKNTINF